MCNFEVKSWPKHIHPDCSINPFPHKLSIVCAHHLCCCFFFKSSPGKIVSSTLEAPIIDHLIDVDYAPRLEKYMAVQYFSM